MYDHSGGLFYIILSKMSLYNLRNPAVKRLMKEAEELCCPTNEYHAQPLEDNLFEWHFTIRGPPNSDFDGGIYHGRITLPPDYPMKPPSIILLTPNGRFEVNKKICLSISGYHPESWQPSWSIRTALLAIIGFMPTHGNGALGSLDYTPEERKELALKSQDFICPECGCVKDIFLRKKSSESEKHDDAPNLPSNILNETNTTALVSTDRTYSENVSENYVLEQSAITSGEGRLLVRRHNTSASTVTSDETSHIEQISSGVKKSAPKKVSASENRHNLLYLIFIFFIVSLLLFLILRRIFFI